MGTHYGVRPVTNRRINQRWRTRKLGTPTTSFATGIWPAAGGASDQNLNSYGAIVLEFKMKFPRNPVDGTIIDLGATVYGGGLFVRDSGTVLRVRCGDGSEVQPFPVSDSPTHRACIFDTTRFPKDGKIHLVTLQLAPDSADLATVGYIGTAHVAMWIDNVFKGKGEAFGGANARDGRAFGGNTGGFFFANSVPVGETGTAINSSFAKSNLSYWNNKVVDYGI